MAARRYAVHHFADLLPLAAAPSCGACDQAARHDDDRSARPQAAAPQADLMTAASKNSTSSAKAALRARRSVPSGAQSSHRRASSARRPVAPTRRCGRLWNGADQATDLDLPTGAVNLFRRRVVNAYRPVSCLARSTSTSRSRVLRVRAAARSSSVRASSRRPSLARQSPRTAATRW